MFYMDQQAWMAHLEQAAQTALAGRPTFHKCAPCQVTWYGEETECWVCGSSDETRRVLSSKEER